MINVIDSFLIMIAGIFIVISAIFIVPKTITHAQNKKELEIRKSQLNDIVVFEDSQAYYIHEILDFEETILRTDDDLHMKNVNGQDVKKFIEWSDYKGNVDKLDDESRIIVDLIPASPLDDKTSERIFNMITETREYERQRQREIENEKHYNAYKKANLNNERVQNTRTFETSLSNYGNKLEKAYKTNSHHVNDNIKAIEDTLSQYARQ